MDFNQNILLYYAKTSYTLLYQRPHQIMRHFDKSWTKIFLTNEPIREYIKDFNLYVWSYSKRNSILSNINTNMNTGTNTNTSTNTNTHNLTVYFTDSRMYNEILDLKIKFPQMKIVYDLIDAPLNEFEIWKPYMTTCIKQADYVTYSHPKLIEYITPYRKSNVHYISNACDYEMFSKAKNRIYPMPKEFEEIQHLTVDKKILGYYGAFSHWIDMDIVKKLADDSRFHVVMIGGIPSSPDYNVRFQHPNITWIDHKPYEQVAHYLSWFDICLLPFKNIKLSEYVNPCKLWEYVATDKPIFIFNINVEHDNICTYRQVCDDLKCIIER